MDKHHTQKKPTQRTNAGRAKAHVARGERRGTTKWGGIHGAVHSGGAGASCYSFHSCLRTICGAFGQFWPDFLPIVGAQVDARHRACGGKLNGDTALQRHLTHASSPLPNKLRLGTYGTGQICFTAMLRNVIDQFHVHSISGSLNQMQEFIKRCAHSLI